jgi:hypothetical protein
VREGNMKFWVYIILIFGDSKEERGKEREGGFERKVIYREKEN